MKRRVERIAWEGELGTEEAGRKEEKRDEGDILKFIVSRCSSSGSSNCGGSSSNRNSNSSSSSGSK